MGAQEAAASKPGGKMKLAAMAVAPVLLPLLGGAYVTGLLPFGYVADAAVETPRGAPTAQRAMAGRGVRFVDLPDAVVNLDAGGQRKRFLKLTVALEVSSSGDAGGSPRHGRSARGDHRGGARADDGLRSKVARARRRRATAGLGGTAVRTIGRLRVPLRPPPAGAPLLPAMVAAGLLLAVKLGDLHRGAADSFAAVAPARAQEPTTLIPGPAADASAATAPADAFGLSPGEIVILQRLNERRAAPDERQRRLELRAVALETTEAKSAPVIAAMNPATAERLTREPAQRRRFPTLDERARSGMAGPPFIGCLPTAA